MKTKLQLYYLIGAIFIVTWDVFIFIYRYMYIYDDHFIMVKNNYQWWLFFSFS